MALLYSVAKPFVHFSKGHYEEQFCEIILNLDQWFQEEMSLKDISLI